MTAFERRSVFSLAILYAIRMLGLFMVLPVFMLYGQELEHASPMLLGIAIGAYGLSQALFQIPFGALSDRFGRKRLIFVGLLLFFFGSVLAALADDIYTVIVGRFLQGSGAIASVLMALLSDLTSEESRTKSMAMVGMSIGLSFSFALILGPVLTEWFGLQGVFWLTALLALISMLWLWFVVPNPIHSLKHRDTRLFQDQLGEVLRHKELIRLDLGIFALHLCLTAVFIAVPLSLLSKAGLAIAQHWLIYLSVLLGSFIAMLPFIIIGEKRRKMKAVFLFAIALLGLGAVSAVLTQQSLSLFWLSLFLFFMAFNLLEASLPSLISKMAPAGSKGTAMGVYSTSQFMGAFVGGVIGGWVLSEFDEQGVYYLVGSVCLVWGLLARGMVNPNPETGMTVAISSACNAAQAQGLIAALQSIKGVEDAVMTAGDNLAYLKVIKAELDDEALAVLLSTYAPQQTENS